MQLRATPSSATSIERGGRGVAIAVELQGAPVLRAVQIVVLGAPRGARPRKPAFAGDPSALQPARPRRASALSAIFPWCSTRDGRRARRTGRVAHLA
jgi:hypothetical protein